MSLDRDKEIIAAYQSGERLEDIGYRFNVTREKVRRVAKKAGLPLRRPDISIGVKRSQAFAQWVSRK